MYFYYLGECGCVNSSQDFHNQSEHSLIKTTNISYWSPVTGCSMIFETRIIKKYCSGRKVNLECYSNKTIIKNEVWEEYEIDFCGCKNGNSANAIECKGKNLK